MSRASVGAPAPRAFDDWPAGVEYAGPWPWGNDADRVAADFTRWYGRAPAAVLWVKPGMFIAGPVVLGPVSTIATNGGAACAGGEVGSPPAAPVEQTTSEDQQAPDEIIPASEHGRVAAWIQPSLI